MFLKLTSRVSFYFFDKWLLEIFKLHMWLLFYFVGQGCPKVLDHRP